VGFEGNLGDYKDTACLRDITNNSDSIVCLGSGVNSHPGADSDRFGVHSGKVCVI